MIAWQWRASLMTVSAVFLAGCQLGPEYVRPVVDLGEHYRQAQDVPGWVHTSAFKEQATTDWWLLYQDTQLTALMHGLNEGNPSIEQAQAQYRKTLALLGSANANLYPTLGLNAQATRSDAPVTDPSGVVMGGFGPTTKLNAGLGVSWELDLWGAIAKDVERAQSQVQASAADLAAARLSAQAALASSYFQLRGLDLQQALLKKTVKTYARSLALTENLLKAGLVDRSDVSVALAQLEGARSQAIELERQRAVLEHAIATLLGEPVSKLRVQSDSKWRVDAVTVPAGLPSSLLMRRPDVSAAEKRVEAANAQIGVATAAWFPSLTISGNAGYQSSQFSQWLAAPAQFWALGPALAATLFDAGKRSARIEQARAEFDVQAANYRATVLRALQEVEDSLVQLHLLKQQQMTQQRTVRAAQDAVRMKRNQYEKGLTDFLGVAVLETTALNAERNEIALQTERLMASVKLVSSLGGGWSVDDLPNPGNSVRTP